GLYDAVDDETAQATVERACSLGMRLFDTAPYYGSGLAERRLGAVLREHPRDELTVSTKVGRLLQPGDSRNSGWHGAPPLDAYFDFSYDAALARREPRTPWARPCRHRPRPRPRRSLRGGARRRLPRAGPVARGGSRSRDRGRDEPDGDALPVRARGRPGLLPRRRPLHAAR